MNLKSIWTLVLFTSVLFSAIGQSSLASLSDDIGYYSDIVANTSLHTSKIRANKKLISAVEEFLAAEGSFGYTFDTDVWISIKAPQDTSFKIVTWQLEKENGVSQYFGYIQHRDGQVVKLDDHSNEMSDISYATLDKDYWYGSLYYNLVENSDENGIKYYILFGYNESDQFTRNKVADVLYFDNGEPVFGKEIFNSIDDSGRPDQLSRIAITYSADANVTLNYNKGMDIIMFDHLIPRMGNLPGQGPTMLPDGSYSGYKRNENGTWEYVDKLFDQVSQTAPRPQPVIGKDDRNLFGKKN